jgi:hypothetical protein
MVWHAKHIYICPESVWDLVPGTASTSTCGDLSSADVASMGGLSRGGIIAVCTELGPKQKLSNSLLRDSLSVSH